VSKGAEVTQQRTTGTRGTWRQGGVSPGNTCN